MSINWRQSEPKVFNLYGISLLKLNDFVLNWRSLCVKSRFQKMKEFQSLQESPDLRSCSWAYRILKYPKNSCPPAFLGVSFSLWTTFSFGRVSLISRLWRVVLPRQWSPGRTSMARVKSAVHVWKSPHFELWKFCLEQIFHFILLDNNGTYQSNLCWMPNSVSIFFVLAVTENDLTMATLTISRNLRVCFMSVCLSCWLFV